MSDALDIASALVRDDGSRWIESAFPEQIRATRLVLDPDAPPHALLLMARAWGKSDMAATWAIATGETRPNARIFIAAVDRDQARIDFDSLIGYVRRTPLLTGRWDLGTWKATNTDNGATITVLAADAASSWGLRPDLVIADEIAWWPETAGARQFYASLSTAVAKKATARLALISTPSSPTHWSYGIYRHARADPLWSVLHVKGPSPLVTPERLAEQRRQHDDVTCKRLFDCEWTAGTEQMFSEDDLAKCVTLSGPLEPRPGRSYCISLDVGLVNDRTAVMICHGERVTGDDGETRTKVVLDRKMVWSGSRARPVQLQDVEAFISEAALTYRPARIVHDPFQSVQLAQRLRGHGLSVAPFNFTPASVSRIAVALHTLIRNGLLAIPDDRDLIEELSTIKLRETSPGSFRIDHDRDKHDDMAIALALAAEHLTAKAPIDYPGISAVEIRRDTGVGWRTEHLGTTWEESR
jgi:hypothetical protein